MPFRSEAQRKKFEELLKKGEISQATFDEWSKATGKLKLPERIHPKTKKITSIEQIKQIGKKKYGL